MSTDKQRWFPDFASTWYKVNRESYKIIYAEAKEKLEDTLSESESITNKSIKMIAALVAMFSFYVGFFIQNHIAIGYNAVFLLPFLVIVCMVLYLIFPKEIKGRGFRPKEFLPEKLDEEEDKNYQLELLYYSGIVKLQEDIEFMEDKNAARAKIYLASLIGALVVFIACAVSIAISISELNNNITFLRP